MNKTKKQSKQSKQLTCSIPPRDKDITALIDKQALKHNVEYMKKKSKCEIIPVLKANAYGHGLLEMSKIMRQMGIEIIGLATLGEAIYLRKNGDNGRILSWLYDIEGNELKEAFQLDLDLVIFDETSIPKIKKLIPKGKKEKIRTTLFVDTGINRAGISYNKAYDTFKELAECDQFEIVGMMSHFVCSGIKNSPIVNEQLRKFRQLRSDLEKINIKPREVHIANTGAIMNYDVSDFTHARTGTGLYGICADTKIDKYLHLTTTVQTYIIQIKTVEKGGGIGYDWTYIAPHKMKIAILPIGYADIIPQNTSGHLYVYINGTKRKVLGSISMDQMVVEAYENDKINDIVYIFGNGRNCKQTIFDIAKISNTMVHEILCHSGYRINRTYI